MSLLVLAGCTGVHVEGRINRAAAAVSYAAAKQTARLQPAWVMPKNMQGSVSDSEDESAMQLVTASVVCLPLNRLQAVRLYITRRGRGLPV